MLDFTDFRPISEISDAELRILIDAERFATKSEKCKAHGISLLAAEIIRLRSIVEQAAQTKRIR